MAKINPDELTGDVLKAYNIIQKLKKSKNKNLKKKGEVLEKNFIEKLNKAKQVAESKKPVKAPTKKVPTKKMKNFNSILSSLSDNVIISPLLASLGDV